MRFTTEKALWQYLKNNAPGFWVRIENSVGQGTPDCCVLCGGQVTWVELKCNDVWTTNMGLSPLQRLWMRNWEAAGGQAALLCKVGRTFTFHRPPFILKNGSAEEWLEAAEIIWQDQINWNELEEALTHARPDANHLTPTSGLGNTHTKATP